MKTYYINRQTYTNPDNNHEVHASDCFYLPVNRDYLGEFISCHDALANAVKRGYRRVNGCIHCSSPCHDA